MFRTNRAFTIVEMVLAMAIASVVGLSVTAVAMTLSSAYLDGEQRHATVQTGRIALSRIESYINRAKLVTFADDGTILYWAGDADGDGKISLTELAEIKYTPDDRTIRLHRVVLDENMDAQVRAALNVPVPLNAAVGGSAGSDLVESNPRDVSRIEAQDVDAFEVNAYPACPRTKLVTLRLVVGQGQSQGTFRGAASLRADKTSDVATSEGNYVLVDH